MDYFLTNRENFGRNGLKICRKQLNPRQVAKAGHPVYKEPNMTSKGQFHAVILWIAVGVLLLVQAGQASAVKITAPPLNRLPQERLCTGSFLPVSLPLTDLGNHEYIRMDGNPTGFTGGLYPNGENQPPAAHRLAGRLIAQQIVPLDSNGSPDFRNGKIGMISVGMSNTAMEFSTFRSLAMTDSRLNPHLVLVNGAQAGQTAEYWLSLDSPTWEVVNQRLESAGLSPQQVQVVWLKLTRTGGGNFPQKAQTLQADLTTIVQNLKVKYPQVKMVFLSSRTRSYTYWNGLSPEPAAFESGFAVKWLIEEQISGTPDLNYDPQRGAVRAPYLMWAAYLWADGINPREDGFVWLPEDLVSDCTHPSDAGRLKVARLLLQFFTSDPAATPWFLTSYPLFLPLVTHP